MEMQLRQLRLESLDDGHRGVLIEVVHDQYFERSGVRLLHQATQRRHRVLALVVNGNDHGERRRWRGVAQILPASISSRIHGMTSSSISSSVVLASKPRISRALLTSGARRCTSGS